jgi:hypothetical protein
MLCSGQATPTQTRERCLIRRLHSNGARRERHAVFAPFGASQEYANAAARPGLRIGSTRTSTDYVRLALSTPKCGLDQSWELPTSDNERYLRQFGEHMLTENFTARNPHGLPRQSRTTEPDGRRSVDWPSSSDKDTPSRCTREGDLNAGRSISRSRKLG